MITLKNQPPFQCLTSAESPHGRLCEENTRSALSLLQDSLPRRVSFRDSAMLITRKNQPLFQVCLAQSPLTGDSARKRKGLCKERKGLRRKQPPCPTRSKCVHFTICLDERLLAFLALTGDAMLHTHHTTITFVVKMFKDILVIDFSGGRLPFSPDCRQSGSRLFHPMPCRCWQSGLPHCAAYGKCHRESYKRDC